MKGVLQPSERSDISTHPMSLLCCDIFRGGLAGVIAGVLFLGVGARIVMRISALLDSNAKGFITENDNIVGEITVGGTIGLVIFGGIFAGLVAGVGWVIIRDWLPRGLWLRVPLAGVVATAAGSFAVVSVENRDFSLLDPVGVNVAMFVLVVGLTGSATALFDRLLEGRLSTSENAGIAYGVLAALAALVTVPILINSFFFEGESPPRIAGFFLIVAGVATMVANVHWYYPTSGFVSFLGHQHLRVLGVVGVVGVAAFGAVNLADEIDRIVASASLRH